MNDFLREIRVGKKITTVINVVLILLGIGRKKWRYEKGMTDYDGFHPLEIRI